MKVAVLARALTSTLSSKGQTTIPARIRRELAINEGDTIRYEVEGYSVRMRKITPLDREWVLGVESTLTEWAGDDDDDL